MNGSPQDRKKLYFVLHQRLEQGPFELDFIKAMVMAGVYAPGVSVRQTESTPWSTLADLARQPSIAATSQSPPPILPRKLPEFRSSAPPPSNEHVATDGARGARKKPNGVTIFGWVAGAGGLLFLIWIFSMIAGGPVRDTNKPAAASIDQKWQNPPSPPATDYQPSATRPTVPSHIAPQNDSKVYRGQDGRTYRVSNADYSRLLLMKSALSNKGSAIDTGREEFKRAERQLESSRLTLDRTSEDEITSFNQSVARLNAMNERLQIMVDAFNRDVDAFNAELERVGTPIN